jgi:hypothetical protein
LNDLSTKLAERESELESLLRENPRDLLAIEMNTSEIIVLRELLKEESKVLRMYFENNHTKSQ